MIKDLKVEMTERKDYVDSAITETRKAIENHKKNLDSTYAAEMLARRGAEIAALIAERRALTFWLGRIDVLTRKMLKNLGS